MMMAALRGRHENRATLGANHESSMSPLSISPMPIAGQALLFNSEVIIVPLAEAAASGSG